MYPRGCMMGELRSLAALEFSSSSENEGSETWLGWSSQPKFAFGAFLIEL